MSRRDDSALGVPRAGATTVDIALNVGLAVPVYYGSRRRRLRRTCRV
jgi:hypothetical protein